MTAILSTIFFPQVTLSIPENPPGVSPPPPPPPPAASGGSGQTPPGGSGGGGSPGSGGGIMPKNDGGPGIVQPGVGVPGAPATGTPPNPPTSPPPPPPVPGTSPSPLTVTAITPVSGFIDTPGDNYTTQTTAYISGGIPPYSFTWTDIDGPAALGGRPSATVVTPTGLSTRFMLNQQRPTSEARVIQVMVTDSVNQTAFFNISAIFQYQTISVPVPQEPASTGNSPTFVGAPFGTSHTGIVLPTFDYTIDTDLGGGGGNV